MSLLSFSDNIVALRLLRLMTMPYSKTAAYKTGAIDEDGKILVKYAEMSQEQKESYTILHRMAFNLRRLLAKVPVVGKSILLNYAAAMLLIKEHTGLSDDVLKDIVMESIDTDNKEMINTVNESFLLIEDAVAPSVTTTAVGNVDIATTKTKKKKKSEDDTKLLLSKKEQLEKDMKIEEEILRVGHGITKMLSPFIHSKNYTVALNELVKLVKKEKKPLRHGIHYYATEIANNYVGVDGRKLATMFFKWYNEKYPKDDLKLKESIDKSAKIDVWIKDFADSDAPQFKGKSKEERRKMAVAAYLSNKMQKEENEAFADELLNESTNDAELQKKAKIILTTSEYAEEILDAINDHDQKKVDALLKHDVPDQKTRTGIINILFHKK